MNRLILVGPNSAFPRASARPASASPSTRRDRSPSLPVCGNFEAGFSSGVSPDAAPGGTRSSLNPKPSAELPSSPAAAEGTPDSDEEYAW